MISKIKALGIFCTFLFLIYSCASYKAQYADKKENFTISPSDIDYTIYLIGDGGNAKPGEDLPVLKHLEKRLSAENSQSSIIWLGDNIYPHGLSDTDRADEYSLSTYRLMSQLKTMDNYKGQVFFIPGNHDWYEYGKEGLRRQELYIENYLDQRKTAQDKSTYFIPNKSCPTPTVISLNHDYVFIATDSQWQLNDEELQQSSDCFAKNESEFIKSITDTLSHYKNKNIILGMHHPPYSYGSHGGHHHWSRHIFPLLDVKPYLLVPLPIISTVFHYFRSRTEKQDVHHPKNKNLRQTITSSLKDSGPHIVVSGHEHALQYIDKEGQHFIVSGSASKSEAVGMGDGSQFATSQNGYAKISILKNKKRVLEFFVNDSESGKETRPYVTYLP